MVKMASLISEGILHGQRVCGQPIMLTQPKGLSCGTRSAELKQKSAVEMLSCLVHSIDRLREDEKGEGLL